MPGRFLTIMTGVTIMATVASPRTVGASDRPRFQRPVATYSIVARDPSTGEMGVAVQSHWFSVGSVVSWAEAGVGAVATQSLVDPAYGPLGLDLMRAGRSGPDALRSLLAGDEGRDVRQVAMIDTQGRVEAHTGDKCIAAAGHVVDEEHQFSVQSNLMIDMQGRVAAHTGVKCIADAGQLVDTEHQFSVQANLMANDSIWQAMAQAYRESGGDLADRLVAALEAAQSAGGDVRGRQSAALVIVSATSTGKPWIDRRFDLRIEDHPRPVQELKRLVRLQRAYLHMNAGDLAIEHGDFAQASREYASAEKLAPEIVEIPFWYAVTLAASNQVDESLPVFRRVFAREPIWADLVPRLVPPGILPDDDALLEKIDSQR